MGPRQQVIAFAHVVGERGSGLERLPGVFDPTQVLQHFTTDDLQRCVVTQTVIEEQRLQMRPGSERALAAQDGYHPVQRHHRRRLDLQQPRIQPGDACPIGLVGRR